MENKRIVMASFPEGWVKPENFRLETVPVERPADGQVLVKNLWLSLDPYMRGRMSQQKSYAKGVEVGEVMTAQTVGEVVESKHPGFKPGDKVLSGQRMGWQLYGCAKGDELTKVDDTRAPLSYYLGCLGMPGLTAYFGLKEIGAPKAGETVVVSAASGAVGSVVGQLAKAWGCRAVGIAGGVAKCDYVVKELGFDACVDYKAGNLHRDLKEACPKGIDVNFENVGGEVMDTVLRLMNPFSRMIVCGLISDYNAVEPYAMKNYRAILVNRIKVQGMIVFDWQKRYGEGIRELGGLLAQGKLKYRESVVEGIENAPQAFIGLLKGQNFGKQLVKLA
jgi:NADPH-dependent curcumin reductase CurA